MANKPNILMIVSDQLIPMMTGAYGNPVAHTPTMDRFSQEGITFDAAYSTCPVCVPARISLLSGKYLASLGCSDNGSILSAEEPTHNHYLNLAGYDTALAGKAHFIGPEQLHGFQHRFMTDIYPANFHFMPRRETNLNFKDLHPNPIAIDYIGENVGVRQASMQLDYDEEAVFQAIRYLRSRRTKMSGTAQKPLPKRDDRPFFLQLSLNHPHEPFHVLQRHWDLYEDVNIPIPGYPEHLEQTYTSMDRSLITLHGSEHVQLREPDSLRRLQRAYLAAVSYVDEKIEQVLQALEDYGLMDDTVVIFCSDHGDMLGHRAMVQKRVFYEYSSRIALMVRFPDNLAMGTPGHRVSEPVSITDITPTLLDLAGVENWLPMDGRSLLPLIAGRTEPGRHVFCENYSEGVTTVCLMVRQGPWKYTYIHPDEAQLFNLEADPGEWDNLSGRSEYAAVETQLRSLILDRFDPGELDRRAQTSYEKRMIVRHSGELSGGPTWNYRPPMDVDKMYWRTEE